jgi:hypothetical protein
MESPDSPSDIEENAPNITYAHEFAIEGITCANCTNAIERGLRNQFGKKGLISASCLLLTHKLAV